MGDLFLMLGLLPTDIIRLAGDPKLIILRINISYDSPSRGSEEEKMGIPARVRVYKYSTEVTEIINKNGVMINK